MKTLKRILIKALLGGIIEISVTYLITVIISLCINDGNFHAVVPQLIKLCGTEQNAVFLQLVLSFGMGFVIGCATIVFSQDSWSLLLQTVIHFILVFIAITPVAWICRWIPHNIKGIIIYFGYFIFVYTIIWISTMIPQWIAVKKINQKIDRL